ncbi:MAG: ACT domain-containing protein [Promethearchaeota archaeon]
MIELEVKLPDRPGSLIELIKPISDNGGNIHGILHHHDRIENNLIPVSITFELNEITAKKSLEKIKKELKSKNIEITKLFINNDKKSAIIILIGHVFDTDLLDTINRLAKSGFFISELQAKFTDFEDISNVKLKINFSDSLTKQDLIILLEQICHKKDLFLISN